MKIGLTILTDTEGGLFVHPGAGDVVLPIADIAKHKALVKAAAGAGLRVGKRVFTGGQVISHYGTEYRKTFPVIQVAAKKG